jgi:hypothetical protein
MVILSKRKENTMKTINVAQDTDYLGNVITFISNSADSFFANIVPEDLTSMIVSFVNAWGETVEVEINK